MRSYSSGAAPRLRSIAVISLGIIVQQRLNKVLFPLPQVLWLPASMSNLVSQLSDCHLHVLLASWGWSTADVLDGGRLRASCLYVGEGQPWAWRGLRSSIDGVKRFW
jgi:hypothetical protein